MTTSPNPTLPTVTIQPVPGLMYDKARDGWKLEHNNLELASEKFTLTLDVFIRPSELSWINGVIRREWAKTFEGCAGQIHAERLLAQQALISTEWRPFRLVFLGTVWLRGCGRQVVPCLSCNADRWVLGFYCIGNALHGRGQIVRLDK